MGRLLLELGPSRAQESGTHLGEGRSGGASSSVGTEEQRSG